MLIFVLMVLCFLSFQLVNGFNRVVSMVDHGKYEVELSKLRREIAELKKDAHDSAARVGDLEREKEKSDAAVGVLKEKADSLATDKRALQALVISYQKIETNLTAALAKSENDRFEETFFFF